MASPLKMKAKEEEHPVPYTLIEWNRVTQLVRSINLQDMEECLNYLTMWTARMGSRTPIAITSTAMVMHVAVKEQKMTSPVELDELKLLISITIIRFINFISEARRNRTAQSIYECCEQAGIPRWVVEIRHDASHQHMPSLGTLKRAIDVCKSYLVREFWSKSMHDSIKAMQEESDESESESSNAVAIKLRRDINQGIYDYFTWRSRNLHLKATEKHFAVATLQKFLTTNAEIFIGMFVNPGQFLLNQEQGNRLGVNIVPQWQVPLSLKSIWAPIIALIMDAGLTCNFVLQLFDVKINAHRDDVGFMEWQAAAWLNELLARASRPDIDIFDESEWEWILRKLVQAPEGFPTLTIEHVMAKVPKLERKVRRQLRRMLDIQARDESVMPTEMSTDSTIYTANDLERLLQKKNRLPVSDEMIGLFKEIDPFEEQLPAQIGLAPGQKYETISLVIDDEWLAEADAVEKRRDTTDILLETIDEDLGASSE